MLTGGGNPLSGNGSLRRRRGTRGRGKPRRRGQALWAVVCLLFFALIGALSLLAGLYTSLTAEEKSALPDRMRHQVQAVPNLLRGHKVADVPVPPGGGYHPGEGKQKQGGSNNKLQPPAAERFQVDPLENHHVNHHAFHDDEAAAAAAVGAAAQHAEGESAYPYALDKPADADEIASYRPRGGFRYKEYTDGTSPYAITDALRRASDTLARSRRPYIKGMMQFAWQGYTKYAFGFDEVKPQSAAGDNGWGGQGITLVDALDTLWLMGMKEEFHQARDWVRDHLDHSKTHFTSLFETTIRDLGGLLSAYDLSGEQVFLTKAVDLGNRLLHGFDNSPSGIPYGQVDLANGKAKNIGKYESIASDNISNEQVEP